MSIILNGTKLGSRITFNNIDLSKIIFNGTTVWESGPTSLEDATWQQISDSIKNGTFSSYASVGDTKSFEINGKTYHAEVVSINDGTGEAGQWYPNKTVDFVCTELYETEYRYNATNTNTGGFPSSEIKNTLNNTIYPLLPSDLKAVIINKLHSYESGYYISSSKNSYQKTILATKLWLPTREETNLSFVDRRDLNKTYVFNSLEKKLNGETDTSYWWSATPFYNSSSSFAALISQGTGIAGVGASSTSGVPICFRIGATLEDLTWQEVNDSISNGTFSQYASVGDTKSFIMNGKTYHAEVVSINDGTGEAGQWYPNRTVDFICKELYEIPYLYNSTNTNSGGFPGSELRETLVNTIYPLLPSDLKGVIVNKSHSYNISTSGTMGTDATKLWLPTQYEISGATATYAPGETSSNNKAYTLASKFKNLNGQSSASEWWFGTIYSNNDRNFWFQEDNSESASGRSSHMSIGVPICFRIGPERKVLEDLTWQQISDSISDGTFSQYAIIGDTKSFEINGKTYHAEVVSINDCAEVHTAYQHEGYPEKTVDFICKETYETRYQYNSTLTNRNGFPDSALWTTLKDTIYPLLPSDLKNVIIKKIHHYENLSDAHESELWLPTYYEIFNDVSQYSNDSAFDNIGYTLASKVKKRNENESTTSEAWWLGSSVNNSTASFWLVDNTGNPKGDSAPKEYSVPICFRIGVPSNLEDATWQQISNSIKNGTFSQFASVGDTKSFEINGKTYHAEVVAINDGTGDAASWYPNNTVDFICTELYETEYRYNSSAINAGGFPSSEIKNTLNDTIYPLLPSDLKAVIIDKSHSYQSGSYSGSSWSSQMTTLATKLWLPTQYEITGTISKSAMGEESSNNKKYILSSLIKIKNGSTSSASDWWLSSPCASNPNTFYYVHSSGVVYASKYASGLAGVPICFRLG